MKKPFARVLAPLSFFALVTVGFDVDAVEAPPFSTLPVGRMTTPPLKKGPEAIAQRESVPGFYVVAEEGGRGWRAANVVGDAKTADALKNRKRAVAAVDESNVCFIESQLSMMMGLGRDRESLDDRFLEWGSVGSGFRSDVRVLAKSKDNPQGGVVAVHSERVVEQNGTASLESIDAWVDPTTRGARLISKASLPLAMVGTAMGGLKVFAGRDERSDGKRFVQIVVTTPKDGASELGLRQMWATKQDGQVLHGGCSHLRVGLPLDAKGNSGEQAIFEIQNVLPSPEDKAPPVKVAPEAGTDTPQETEKEVRLRLMQVQASVSKASRDKDPVVSVSLGWGGREQAQRVPAQFGRVRF